MTTDTTVFFPAQFRVMDMATGVVMYQRGCDSRAARARLRELAFAVGKPLDDVADVVVRAAGIGCTVAPHRRHVPPPD